MDFDEVRYTDTYIIFNNTGFNLTSGNNININIRDIDDDMITADNDELLVSFSEFCVDSNTFEISGFNPNTIYNVTEDGVWYDECIANASGVIDFSVKASPSRLYRIFKSGNNNHAPVVHAEYPNDGATEIPVTGSTVSVRCADDDDNLMRTDVWWYKNTTGDWYQVAGYDVYALDNTNNSRIFYDDYNDDGQINFQDSGLWWVNDGWEGDGVRSTGFSSSWNTTGVTAFWGLTDYSTTYFWSVNCTDGTEWTNTTYYFTTESNTAPTISSPSPSDGATGVSIGLSSLSVSIADAEDTFDWTITTSPNIGSSSGSGESDGTKTCSVSGLTYDAYYTWTVSATDGVTWTNTTYDFTVESDPGGGPGDPNEAPQITLYNPSDESYIAQPQPVCMVLITDGDFDSVDVNFFWQNESDVFVNMQNNDSVNSGDILYWNYTNATSYDTEYVWRVTAYDGEINISRDFSFTVRPNMPYLNWTIPSDGATGISINGSVVNADIFDYQGDSINVTIWSDYTGEWVKYAGYGLSTPPQQHAFLRDNNEDGEFQEFVNFQNLEGWQENGTRGMYDFNPPYNYVVTDDWGMEQSDTIYYISFNITDDAWNWNNQTISFSTEVSNAPSIYDPIPRNGVRWISIHTSSLTVMISDSNSNFNYTIETDPNIGSLSEDGVSSGEKNCSIAGLEYSTTYTWYVNATDGEQWDREVYTFTTKGATDFDLGDIDVEGFPEWAVGQYKVYISDFIWVFLFIGMIGFVWTVSHNNVGATLASILLIFAAYGGKRAFLDGMGQQVSLLFSVIGAICLAVLILGLFLRKRHG